MEEMDKSLSESFSSIDPEIVRGGIDHFSFFIFIRAFVVYCPFVLV